MTIYDIDKQILDLVDPETGEITDLEAFDSLNLSREEKVKNIALFYKNVLATAKAIAEEIKVLSERRRVLENKADRPKKLLEYALHGEAFLSPEVEVRYRKSTALEVEDEEGAIRWLRDSGHADCLRVPPVTLSKGEVTALLKEGAAVPGVSLVERQNMGVR